MTDKADNKSNRDGPVRCQCTLASESQITDIFRSFAVANPAQDISYQDVHDGLNQTGRQNAVDLDRFGSGERQCFGCDPLLHKLVEKFNEAHDPEMLFARQRQGGRKGRLAQIESQSSGLCSVAQNHDYSGMIGAPPDLRSDPVNGGKPKSRAPAKP